MHGRPHGHLGGGSAGGGHDRADAAGAALSHLEGCSAHHRLHGHSGTAAPEQEDTHSYHH